MLSLPGYTLGVRLGRRSLCPDQLHANKLATVIERHFPLREVGLGREAVRMLRGYSANHHKYHHRSVPQ